MNKLQAALDIAIAVVVHLMFIPAAALGHTLRLLSTTVELLGQLIEMMFGKLSEGLRYLADKVVFVVCQKALPPLMARALRHFKKN